MAPPNVAVIVGSSQGLGLHLARSYLARTDLQVVSLSRKPSEARNAILDTKAASPLNLNGPNGSKKTGEADAANMSHLEGSRLTNLEVDVRNEESLQQAASEVSKKFGDSSLRLLFNVAGKLTPEKNLGQVEYEEMLEQFKINTFFPLLSFKHFVPLLPKPVSTPNQPVSEKDDPAHGLLPSTHSILASLSARVGSINDNERGGWYSYRASKAAQNMITKSLSRELANRNLAALACALHPGTVRSELSREFTGGPGGMKGKEKKEGEFEADEAANNLIEVLKGLHDVKGDNGKFFDWRGKEVPW